MKQKQGKFYNQFGFTIVELMVVLTIMVMLATVIIIDFNRQRGARNILIAKNETITNLRKIQNYILTSRNISTGVPAKFYIATLQSGATSYTIQAVDNTYTFHDNLETVNLPSDLSFASLRIAPSSQSKPVSYPCVQVIFSAPFGTIYTRGALTCDSSITTILSDPVAIAGLGQNKTDIYFAIKGVAQSSYIEISPFTGQMRPY